MNLLYLFTDEQRFDALRAYGNPQIDTPHLDRLAAEGVLFDRAYETQPVCTPSRSTLLTGHFSPGRDRHAHSTYFDWLEPHMPFFGPRDEQYDPDGVPLPPNFTHPPGPGQSTKDRKRAAHSAGYEQFFGTAQPNEQDWRRLIARYWGLVSQIDLVPTLLDYMEQPVPEGLDGFTLRTVITPDLWKLNWRGSAENELYHLADDPHETANLAGREEHRERVMELRRRIEHWQRRTGDEGPPGTRKGRRIPRQSTTRRR